MGYLNSARQYNSSNLSLNNIASTESDIAVVYNIILDENSEVLKKFPENERINYIGSVVYRTLLDNKSPAIPEKDMSIAQPFDRNQKSLPVINEKIQLVKTGMGVFYKRIQTSNSVNNSANINQIYYGIATVEDKDEKPSIDKINEIAATGIQETDGRGELARYRKFGNYFKTNNFVHKLKLYEGDLLIESRFGQSIRFSGYNNNLGGTPSESPTLIIRNGESSQNLVKPNNVTVEEDVNRDGSIIAMTSNEYQMEFRPGLIDNDGKSNFETKPESFLEYPQKLTGNQMLLNSGRLIFSAKTGEMIFYSKKNYGFISDGNLSIDNKLGIDINVRDNISIVTNDKDVNMVTNNGKIFLGSKDLEPMVKGQKLVEILGELIDAIGFLQFKTPAGPSAIGSENRKDFENIKAKLNNILSGLNQTA